MPTFQDLINRREKLIADAEAQAVKRLRGMESDAWGYVADVVNGLDQVEGKIVFKAANIRRANSGVLGFTTWLQGKLFNFGQWLVGRFLSIFGVNVSYFNTVKKQQESAYEQAKKLILFRWGWDVEKKQIVPGGFLANAFNAQTIAEQVGQRLTAAISGGMDLKTFIKIFKADFVSNVQGSGLIERNFARAAQDSFQMFDRTVQNTVAGDLGLNYALYSGTEIKTSRQFCKDRNGIIYSRKVIESWNSLNWDGKIPGTDVKETLGGFRCRHHLSWLSSEMVELLKKRGTKVDVYD